MRSQILSSKEKDHENSSTKTKWKKDRGIAKTTIWRTTMTLDNSSKKRIETNHNSQLVIIGGKKKEDTPHKGPLVKVQVRRKCNNQNAKRNIIKRIKGKKECEHPWCTLNPKEKQKDH